MKTLPALQKRGHELMVITAHGEMKLADETHYAGIPVHRFFFRQVLEKRNLSGIRDIKDKISALKRSFQPSIIHLHYPGYTAYFHMITARAEPAPTLLTIHTPFPGVRSDRDTLFGQVLRSASWVTAVSEATLSDTLASVPEVRSRSSVIYNGLPLPTLPRKAIPFERPRLLYVGRLAREKGVDLLLSAFPAIRKSFSDVRLTIAGDGPARQVLEHQAALGHADAIKFVGWIHPQEIPDLINDSTIVVIPSRYREPFGLIAVEAAQLARPVVASRTGGLPEIVVDGQTGLLFENENSGELARSVLYLLESPEKAVRMGEAGYERATKLFSQERFVNAYDKLYHRLVRSTAVTNGD